MKLTPFLLLCLTGLVPVVKSILRTVPHKYDLITTSMTWTDAQKYCRLMHDDLATILSYTDWLRLKKVTASKSLNPVAWIGLYSDIYNWRWTLNDTPLSSVTFTNWYPGQPENFYKQELCAIIAANNQLHDVQCNLIRPFICYDASRAKRFIGISNPLTWPDARIYCQTYHTDLASSLNSSDYDILVQWKMINGDSWIGLYRDMETWKWTDRTSASNIPWYPGQPDNYAGAENCALVYNGMFYDEKCTNQHYFYCHTIFPRRSQIMRLRVKSDGSVFDPAVQLLMLDQVKQTLEKNGETLENFKVTWRVQPDGNIFHKREKDGL